MIVIKLWGGMGNQLFQYAFGYMLAKEYNDNLRIDTTFYNTQPGHVAKRAYISEERFPNFKFSYSFSRPLFLRVLENRYISHAIRQYGGVNFNFLDYHIFIEHLRYYHKVIPYVKDKINYYDGYWQSAKYFERYRKDLLNLFSPSQNINKIVEDWRNSLCSNNMVGVHVRRGDYTRNNKSSKLILGIDYYKESISLLRKKLDNPLFCIFSDDIDWCKTQFPEVSDIVFVENKVKNGDLIDLFSIVACNHGIMSMSTFSWWGNWLRKDQSSTIVVYPQRSFFNEYFFPDNWISIDKLKSELN